MASTDPSLKGDADLAGLEAGLDALETRHRTRIPLRQTFVEKILPPTVAVLLVLAMWQALVSFKIVDDPTRLPAPSAVWDVVHQAWLRGELLGYIWTSVSRGLSGFLLALLIGTPLGLLVARVKVVRAAIGPIL
ncbi:ABC transporter permease, partial [Streptomyces sp. NPDC058534]|uniref:ABC transporter permease n=1 Tax=Streptomyces sp. NPDC058534 TaxID=3346541 RepID=UPI0036518CF8